MVCAIRREYHSGYIGNQGIAVRHAPLANSGLKTCSNQEQEMTQQITFGIFDHLDVNGEHPAQQYAGRLRFIAACDRMRLYAYHLAEHHGTAHGPASAPNLFLAAASQRTERIRLGPMVLLLPLYHPLRAVEEICMLDQISNGRLDLGVGKGAVPMEHAFFGVEPGTVTTRYRETLEILQHAMTADVVQYEGAHYQLHDVPMAVRPLQQPHPPLWCGTVSRETASWAERHNVNMIALGPSEGIRALNAIHRSHQQVQSTASTPLFLGMLRTLVIADTDARAYALAETADRRWYHSLVALWRQSGLNPPYAIDDTIESAIATGMCAVGTAATVRDQLADDLRVAGSNYVAVQPLLGCMRVEDGIATLAALEAEVIPKLAA